MRTSFNQFQQPVRTSLSQSQPVSTTRRNWFELVTASEEPVWASHSQFQHPWTSLTTSLRQSQPVSTPRKNQFEPVWASHSQFQQPGGTCSQPVWTISSCENQFQPVSTASQNQFEPVTANFNNQEELVSTARWFFKPTRFSTPVVELVWASHSQWRTSLS